MSIETQPLRLGKFQLNTQTRVLYYQEQEREQMQGQVSVSDYSPASLSYLLAFQKGLSLSEIVLNEFKQGKKPDFQGLFKILDLLTHLGLIKNKDSCEQIKRLRPQYGWSNSLIKGTFAHVEISKIRTGFLGVLTPIVSFIIFALGCLSMLSGLNFLFIPASDSSAASSASSFVFTLPFAAPFMTSATQALSSIPTSLPLASFFVGFVVAVFLSHFLVTFIESFLKLGAASSVASGVTNPTSRRANSPQAVATRGVLGLNFGFLGFGFTTSRSLNHKSHASHKSQAASGTTQESCFVYLPSLTSAFFIFSLAKWVKVEPFFLTSIWLGVCLYTLFCFSPFSWTPITGFLKNLFTTHFDKKAFQNLVRTVTTLRLLWIIIFGGILLFVFVPFVHFLWVQGKQNASQGFFAILILAYLSLFLLSFLEDIFKSIDYGSLQLTEAMNHWLSPQETSGGALSSATEDTLNGSMGSVKNLPFIRLLPEAVSKKILEGARLIKIKKGIRVCRQGSVGRDMFIVISGSLAVIRKQAGYKETFITRLEKGAVFGEGGYFLAHRRSADVVCEQEGLLLCLKYKKNLMPHDVSGSLEDEKSQALRHRIWSVQSVVASPLFSNLPEGVVDRILNCGKIMDVSQGVHVINEGEVSDGAYFVIQGQLKTTKKGKVIRKMDTGDFFGEISLLRPSLRRTATVSALSSCLLLFIEASLFYKLLSENLPLALIIDELSLKRLGQ